MKVLQATAPRLPAMSVRSFGHTKYRFDDEDWKPNQFQVSSNNNLLTIRVILGFRCFPLNER